MRPSNMIVGVLCVVAVAGQSARAALTPLDSNGVAVVHSSFTNITWLQDANLLGGMFATRGFEPVVNDIIAAVPTVTFEYNILDGPQTHTVSAADYFNGTGQATFQGSYAFVQYLNAIAHGGVTTWRLPDAVNTVYPNPFPSGYVKSGDFGQLYYDELNSPSGFGIADPSNLFANEQAAIYWSFTHFADTAIVQPFGFHVGRGDQFFISPTFGYYIWPVANGVVPEPTTAIPLGLLALAARRRRRRTSHSTIA